jgi:MFS family permease
MNTTPGNAEAPDVFGPVAKNLTKPLLSDTKRTRSIASRVYFVSTILFVNCLGWATCSAPTSFLAISSVGQEISPSLVGLVFSAFYGGSFFAAFFVETLIERYGTFNVVCSGVMQMILSLSMFSLTPCAIHGPLLIVPLVIFSVSFGAANGFVQASLLPPLIRQFPGHSGKLQACYETSVGIGLGVGPIVGDIYLLIPPREATLRFAAPFICITILLFCVLSLFFCCFNKFLQENDEIEQLTQATGSGNLPSWTLVLILFANFETAAVWESTSSTLALRMAQPPYSYSPALIGLYISIAAVSYVLSAWGCGVFVDWANKRRDAAVKLLQSILAGFGLLFVTFLMLRCTLAGALTWISSVTFGLGQAMIIIPSLPLLSLDLDSARQTSLTGYWLGSVIAGQMIGQFIDIICVTAKLITIIIIRSHAWRSYRCRFFNILPCLLIHNFGERHICIC